MRRISQFSSLRIILGRVARGVLLLSMVGCGSHDPNHFHRAGTVTYDGKPVPYGELRFAPDLAQGTRGSVVIVTIDNGSFQTQSGKGTLPGSHRARFLGFDGQAVAGHDADLYPHGRPLFSEIKLTVDLPAEASTHTFELSAPSRN